jgi:hypothetical protein
MKKYRDERTKKAKTARALVVAALRQRKVESVEVRFDGYGDSGGVEGITYTPAVDGKQEVYDTPHQVTDWSEGEPRRSVRNYTLDELVQEVCYSLLGAEHPGWEINEGSYGTFAITPKDDTVALTFHQRITDVETFEEVY